MTSSPREQGSVRVPSPPAPDAEPRRPSRAPHVVAIAFAATVLLLAGMALAVLEVLLRRPPELEPRHRPEALCFALAKPPPFTPPMAVQPSAALVRGRFGASMPTSYALREQMQLDEDMVLREWTHPVGDYEVTLFWLQLPGRDHEHWLVAAWMEGADLAVCNFRFSGTTQALSAQEKIWGMRLLRRILQPEYFRRGTLPEVTLRPRDGATMPAFGPAT